MQAFDCHFLNVLIVQLGFRFFHCPFLKLGYCKSVEDKAHVFLHVL